LKHFGAIKNEEQPISADRIKKTKPPKKAEPAETNQVRRLTKQFLETMEGFFNTAN
jgi:hypothetical protein